jgi:thiol-disulfide isomerase/thioredoxin
MMKQIGLVAMFFIAGLPLAYTQHTKSVHPRGFSVTIMYDEASLNDTLLLNVVHAFGATRYDEELPEVMDDDHLFHFNVETTEACGYFQIRKRVSVVRNTTAFMTDEFVPRFFWESGDDIQISVIKKPPPHHGFAGYDNYRYQFSGKGSIKYTAKYCADSVYMHTEFLTQADIDKDYRYTDRSGPPKAAAIKTLETFKDRMSSRSLNVAKADVLCTAPSSIYLMLREAWLQLLAKSDTAHIQQFRSSFRSTHPFARNDHFNIPEQDLAASYNFVSYTIWKMNMRVFISSGKEFSATVYDSLKATYKSELRDMLLVGFFLTGKMSSNIDKIYADALHTVKTPVLLQWLKRTGIRMPGMKAFDFSFYDSTGRIWRLKDFKGKTVLLDFWYNGCGPCAGYYRRILSKAEDHFASDTSVVFISVASDINKSHWLEGLYQGIYASKRSVNLYTGGKGINDLFMRYYGFTATPTAVLIDKNMKLVRFNSTELFEESSLIRIIDSIKTAGLK